MNVIRTKGLIVLVSILLLSILTLVLFSGTITRAILESQLSSLNGAEVNIDDVEITFIPLLIKLEKIQVTNNEKPVENSVELHKAVLELDTRSLLRGRFIVNELQLANIQFATHRKEAGKVFVKEELSEEDKTTALETDGGFISGSSLKMPDMDELINKMGLDSENAFKAVSEKAEETRVSWENIELRLSDKKKWGGYSSRYSKIKIALKKGKVKERLQALKDFKVLKKEVTSELNAIKKGKDKVKKDSDELKALYTLAKKMPNKDLEKIKSSYSLGSGNVANISRLFFSEEITGYITTARKYYKKFSPYLADDEESAEQIAREKGRYVAFRDYDPQPGLLIKKANFTAALASGKFEGLATNLGFEQDINNQPSVIELNGSDLKHSKAEAIGAVLDIRDKKKPALIFNYDIDQRHIKQYKVAGGTTLPLVLETAMLDMHLKGSLLSGQLKTAINSQFRKVKFNSTKGTEDNSFSSLITAAMLNVSAFDIDVSLKGTLSKPDIKIKSDIDNKINKQLSARFAKIKKDYEEGLKLKLKDKYADDIKNIEQSISGLDEIKKSINTKQAEITGKLSKFKK